MKSIFRLDSPKLAALSLKEPNDVPMQAYLNDIKAQASCSNFDLIIHTSFRMLKSPNNWKNSNV